MENNFNITKKIGNYLFIDENNKKWTVPQGLFKKTVNPQLIHSYTDILNYELIEDGDIVSKGGIGRALVGGTLFGGVGAVVGGVTGRKNNEVCRLLQIKITLNNLNNPVEYITLIQGSFPKNSFTYNTAFNMAQQIMSVLQIICDNNKDTSTEEQNDNNLSNNIEEIKKFKQLLDEGIITQQEFEIKKKELLNI